MSRQPVVCGPARYTASWCRGPSCPVARLCRTFLLGDYDRHLFLPPGRDRFLRVGSGRHLVLWPGWAGHFYLVIMTAIFSCRQAGTGFFVLVLAAILSCGQAGQAICCRRHLFLSYGKVGYGHFYFVVMAARPDQVDYDRCLVLLEKPTMLSLRAWYKCCKSRHWSLGEYKCNIVLTSRS